MRPKGRDAITEALRDRIVTGLHVGRYSGGERLPGARAIARDFGVNERVALAALHALAREGIVTLRPRAGAYVTPPHPAGGGSLPHLGAWLVEMLVQARSRGLPPREVGDYARRCLETRRVRAACIECNDDQLHLLCSELADDHGYLTEGVAVEAMRADAAPQALARADVLVTTMFHAPEVEIVAQRLGKPWIAVGLRADVIQEVTRRLEEGPVYYVATDPRFEPKLHRMIGATGASSNLRVLLVGRDDLDAIPPDAPTFVMTSAREFVTRRYGPRAGPGRPIHPPRQFSDDAARTLLSFMVRANLAAIAAGLG